MPDLRLSDLLSLLPSGALPIVVYIVVVLRGISTRITQIAADVKDTRDELRRLNGRLIRIEEWRENFAGRHDKQHERDEKK